MKKKLLSFILAICLIMPCALFLSACGSNPPPDNPHTHNWSTTWSKDASNHWYECDGCDEEKDKAEHNYGADTICDTCGYDLNHTHTYGSTYLKDENGHWQKCNGCDTTTSKEGHEFNGGDTCTICGYENIPVVSSVRDLEIVTYDTGVEGVFTLVKLPDGKNMIIDAGSESTDSKTLIRRQLKNTQSITTVDYFVLTNTTALRTGQAEYILTDSLLGIEVKNLYTPREINDSAPTCYEDAIANAPNTCNKVEVGESNCDIQNSFKDSTGTTYSYKIDFMLPVATANCTNETDATIAISIEYKNKVILISGDATEKTIDGYCTKYGNQKNVDVLITSYVSNDPYAIVNSASRGTDYLTKLSLESGCYAIISPILSGTNVSSLTDKLASLCGNTNVYLLADESGLLTSTVKITSAGVVSVTAE